MAARRSPLRSAGAAEEPASPYVRGVEGFGASSGKLEHLQGARCVATIFVLYHHDWYFSGGARSFWGRNGLAAVDFFVVLSGFATHWSNRRKRLELSPPERWLGWCLRRARKAVAAVWCTMALDAAVFLRYENWAGSGWLWFGGGGLVRAARCVALVNCSRARAGRTARRAPARTRQYALWCGLSGIPPDAAPRDRACFPLSVPLNFVVGVLAAALAASLDGRDARRGLVADAAAAAVLLAVVLMPSDVSKRRFPLARLWKNAFDPDPGASLFTFERFPPKTAAFLAALVACSAAYVDGVQPRLFGHKRKAL
ncbi:hypothetical protein JL721_4189 [Aureococcus anophagefferens]|nr:hypothetical protein JL721_4189 [Aureococcus anophagefferens]